MSLGQNIRIHREKLGLSQIELAKKLGYKDRSTIAKIENDVNDLTQSKIYAIAQVLETTPAALMGWEEPARGETGGLSDAEMEVIRLFRQLPPDAQSTFPALLEASLKAQGLL